MKKILSNLRTARMGMMFILALMTSLTVQAAADKTALTTAIGEAETYYNTIQESVDNHTGDLGATIYSVDNRTGDLGGTRILGNNKYNETKH